MATYPTKSWDSYEADIQAIGERRTNSTGDDAFLLELGLVGKNGGPTEVGQAYFDARFVMQDATATHLIAQELCRQYEPVLVMCQRLFGVPNVSKRVVETVLRNAGLDAGLTERNLGTLLVILARFEVIKYIKGRGELVVLHAPLEAGQVPSTIFISRETPFSNVMWLTRVLRQCTGHIYWLDKHFQAAGLEAIADAADGNRVRDIRILSLQLPANATPKVIKQYKALQQELLAKQITLEWRFIDSKHLRDSHDRWIIGADSATNVPDVGTIMSGNKSEMSASASTARLQADFLAYWQLGVAVTPLAAS